MQYRLSPRMQALADLAEPGGAVADIGTDHAYLPIYLVESGRVAHAIAMDINEGPLQRAEEHIREAGLTPYIEVRQSDGLTALAPGEVSQIIIAGMGGTLMLRILGQGRAVTEKLSVMLLQPQSGLAEVRDYLTQHTDFRITAEDMKRDAGKYYTILKCEKSVPENAHYRQPLSAIEREYGPLLIRNRHPVLREYLQRELKNAERIQKELESREPTVAVEKGRRQLRAKLAQIRQALEEIK
ncbi:MAG: SAM-dependent methyltransferase [Lachnospiraceae bacterium]|nr:SAM-dependent methyltransferase [Lachnospiraceae bacterium]